MNPEPPPHDDDPDDDPVTWPERIDVNELHELHRWAERLRVSADRLREVVKRVGDEPQAVARHLAELRGPAQP